MKFIKELKNIKNSLIDDEKMIENAFRLGFFYKKYKFFIIGGLGIIIFSICLSFLYNFYAERDAIKYTLIYDDLLKKPNDEKLINELKNGNPKLYSLFLFNMALQNGNLLDLENLGKNENSKKENDLISYISKYYFGSFERDINTLNEINKYALGELSSIQRAYILLKDKKYNEAKEILSKISKDSMFYDIASSLSHYMITLEK